MGQLIKFELKKIFDNKLIYIVAVMVGLFVLIKPVITMIDINKNLGGKAEVEKLVDKYIGDEYTMEEIETMGKEAWEKSYNNETLTNDEYFLANLSNSIYKNSGENYYKINEERLTEKDIENKLKKLSGENKENTYEYKDMEKAQSMISKVSHEKSAYTGGWFNVFDLNVAATMKIILLVVGIATIFTSEYSTRMSYLNLSSRFGRTRLNSAKLIAACIYATVVFIFVTIIFNLSALPLGMPNGNLPLSTLETRAAYDFTITGYYLRTLAMSYLGIIVYTLLIVLLSLGTKNIIISFGLPIAIHLLSGPFNISETVNKYINNLSFAQILKAKNAYNGYLSFNIFGRVVTYPHILIAIGFISCLIMLVVYYKMARNQKII